MNMESASFPPHLGQNPTLLSMLEDSCPQQFDDRRTETHRRRHAMSSETERITNEVLNRHPWDGLERRIESTQFDGAERRHLTAYELRTTNRGPLETDQPAVELPK